MALERRRYDHFAPFTWRDTPSGGMRVKVNATRTGVFEYQDEKGNTVRELRCPEEVFRADSIASLIGAPVTDLHPPVMVDPSNWQGFVKGHVVSAIPADPFVTAEYDVNSADLMGKIRSGDRKETSLGYTADFDPTPGIWEGQLYDGIQRDIFYNHASMGPDGWGRLGPTVAIRTDSKTRVYKGSQDANATPLQAPEKADSVPLMSAIKHKVGQVTFDAGTEQHVSAVDSELDRLSKAAKDACTEATTEKARADSAEKALVRSSDPKAFHKRVTERVWLVSTAREALSKRADSIADPKDRAEAKAKASKYLDDAAVAEATGDDDVIATAIKALNPKVDPTGKDHATLMGMLLALCQASGADESEEEGEQLPVDGMGMSDPSYPKPPMSGDSKQAPRGKFDSSSRLKADRDGREDALDETQKRIDAANAKRAARAKAHLKTA